MSGSGYVTSARGEVINMDELKNKANMPLAKSKQKNSTVKPKVKPRKALNVRGHVPAQGEHVMAPMSQEVKQRVEYIESSDGSKTVAHDTIPPASTTTESGVAETLADVTGIKLSASPEAIKRREAQLANEEISEESSEVLDDILSDLGDNSETPIAEDTKPTTTRRSRKKTTG